jgi:hypothetical protein
MTAITNYGSLISEAGAMYGNGRTDLTSRWAGFVQRAENEINRILRTDEQTAVTTLTAASGVLTCPSDWKRIRSIRQTVSKKYAIEITDIEVIERYLSDITQTGDPYLAAEVGGTIYLAPAPEDGVTFRVFYHRGVTALDSADDADTNWLLTSDPDVYLFAVLKQAAIYDHDDGALQNYSSMFANSIGQLIKQNHMDKHGERLVMMPNGGVA